MQDREAIQDFEKYLNPLKPGEFVYDLLNAGLVDDAPESAKKAYKEWCKEELERQAKGIQA